MESSNIDMREVEERLQDIETKTMVYIKMRMSYYAKDMQSYAQLNRPWRDRTTRARQSLYGFIKEAGKGILEIGIAHGVDYGVSLEFEHEKRYAILYPTLRYYTDRIMSGFRNVMEQIR